LIGVGFLYAATGTLNMATWLRGSRRLTTVTVVQAGFAFVVVGLGIKAAMFPLHGWLPGAYCLRAIADLVSSRRHGDQGVDLLMARFVFDVFPIGAAFGQALRTWVLAPLAATGAIVCSMQAVFERKCGGYSPSHRWRRWGSSCSAFRSRAAAGFRRAVLSGGACADEDDAVHGARRLALSFGARRLDEFAGVAREAPWSALRSHRRGQPCWRAADIGFLAKWRLIEAAYAGAGSGSSSCSPSRRC
jgi:multicomponent Na+:H+ antiporter subunit D